MCLEELTNGTVVGVVTSAMSPADVARHPELRAIAGLPPETRAIVIARQGPDPTSLFAAVEGAVEDLRRDGTLARLSTARFGADLTVAP
jgi:hypothetical protein